MKANRLAEEKSPYLLQHADNPVDWYPWGEGAFQKARKENKPIFLSIGYSTCHWCHVMERESFVDQKTAEILNRHFISIKVDREERPDVDRIYMTAVQAMTGSGGWPLNVWLTPELEPFFGGTYFPPREQWGRKGFPQVLERVADMWKNRREELDASAAKMAEMLKGSLSGSGAAGPVDPAVVVSAFKQFSSSFDSKHGGFGGAPKFPVPVKLQFLMRYGIFHKEKKALDMVSETLRHMARGGIYDQLGGGFHRYSTDERWHVPHFEKMLYDNAQLASVYVEAFQITHDREFARIARETLDYVLRDMTHPGRVAPGSFSPKSSESPGAEGGFYSAEDADSEENQQKKEGAFYVWNKKEILDVLGPKEGEEFCRVFGVEETGNARNDPHGEFTGKNVLYQAGPAEAAKLRDAREKLLQARGKRPRPHLDDKVLTSWNGLMISAFAKAGAVLEEPRYLAAAGNASKFILENLYDLSAKRLYRRWREGERKIYANSDDYAFFIQGLLDLYEASFDASWLERALELAQEQNRLFYDSKEGGFFMTAQDHDANLLVRSKDDQDNVEPSANSVSALNLLRLAQFTDKKDLRETAEKTLAFFSSQMSQYPSSLPLMLSAFEFSSEKPQQIIIAGAPEDPLTQEMLRTVNSRFIPNKILILLDGGENQKRIARLLPLAANMKPIQGRPTAYVCVNYACELPTSDLSVLNKTLDGKD